jgi:hypothetical protein
MEACKRLLVGVACCLGLFAARAPAQEESTPEKEAAPSQAEWLEALPAGLQQYTKDISLTEADVEAFEKHWASFEKVKSQEALHRAAYKAGKVDLSLLEKDEDFLKWAGEQKVEVKTFLPRLMRVMGFLIRAQITSPEVDKQLNDSEAQIEQAHAMLGDAKYQEAKGKLAAFRKVVEAWKSYPAATEDEQKLLDKHEKTLKAASGHEDEEGEAEEGEGHDEDGCGEDEDGEGDEGEEGCE